MSTHGEGKVSGHGCNGLEEVPCGLTILMSVTGEETALIMDGSTHEAYGFFNYPFHIV